MTRRPVCCRKPPRAPTAAQRGVRRLSHLKPIGAVVIGLADFFMLSLPSRSDLQLSWLHFLPYFATGLVLGLLTTRPSWLACSLVSAVLISTYIAFHSQDVFFMFLSAAPVSILILVPTTYVTYRLKTVLQ